MVVCVVGWSVVVVGVGGVGDFCGVYCVGGCL